MGFTITSDQIIWFCTIVGGIWGIWKIIKELRKPNEDLRLTVKKHSELLDNDNRRLKILRKPTGRFSSVCWSSSIMKLPETASIR